MGDRQRILLVDDDTAVRTIMSRVLEDSGYEVAAAPDAETARRLAAHGGWSLMLLDVMLPGESGLELARHLRQSPATADTPILVATARNEPGFAREVFAAGASLFLVKPFSVATLVAMVRAALVPAGDDVLPSVDSDPALQPVRAALAC